MLRAKTKVLQIAASFIVFAVSSGPSMAAPVDISFDFTTGGSANSLVKPGNTFAYTNTGSSDYKMLVNAWSEEKGGYQSATVVNASADYSSVGYKSVATLKGLGTCSAGDSAFNKCLATSSEFAVDGNKSSEWIVMMLDKPLDISSFQINQAGSGAGKLAYYTGYVEPSILGTAGLKELNSLSLTAGAYSFKKPGKGQDPFGTLSISLDKPSYSNVVLINAQSGNTRFTISGLQATTVVPIPAAAWLLGSAMLVLGGISRSRKKHPAITSFGRI